VEPGAAVDGICRYYLVVLAVEVVLPDVPDGRMILPGTSGRTGWANMWQ
jgi:hypothetical protein